MLHTRKNRIKNSITKGLRTCILGHKNTCARKIKIHFFKGSAKWLQDR